MAKSDDRLLSFFVSGALMVGTAACSKEKAADRPNSNPGPHTDHVNEGPAPQNASDAGAAAKEPIHVNPGPNEALEPDVDQEEDIANEGPIPDPGEVGDSPKEEVHVNTNYQKEPIPTPAAAPPPDRTNTNRQEEPAPVTPDL